MIRSKLLITIAAAALIGGVATASAQNAGTPGAGSPGQDQRGADKAGAEKTPDSTPTADAPPSTSGAGPTRAAPRPPAATSTGEPGARGSDNVTPERGRDSRGLPKDSR